MANKAEALPQYIVFDFDRTLIYLYKDRGLLFELGTLMRDYYRPFINVEPIAIKDGYFVWHEAHRIVEEKYEKSKAARINASAEKVVANFELKIARERTLFPKVKESVKNLYRLGVHLAIVSSNNTDVIRFVLSRDGISKFFDGVFGRSLPFDPNTVKPSPQPLIDASKQLNISNDAVSWYVGDDVIDIQAANKAGFVAIGVSSGNYSANELEQAGAVLSFSGIEEIVTFLENQRKQ